MRTQGEAAGFVVVEPYVPAVLEATYQWFAGGRSTKLRHTVDPIGGGRRDITRAAHYLTNSELDMAWLMPLPAALKEFLERLAILDPGMREHGLVFSEMWTHCAVVAFELETSTGKHAGGGLLNLAAYSVLGVAVVPDAARRKVLEQTLRTYQSTLGLRNVHVRAL